MRGRPQKPLPVKIAEGQRVREDRINREAPVPPVGEMVAPDWLSEAGKKLWQVTLEWAAKGQIKPLDGGLLARYCWSYPALLEACAEHGKWKDEAVKGKGETGFLKVASNGVLGSHPILGVIDKLMSQVAQQEAKLGLTPVDREHIHASLQGGLDFNDPWAEFRTPAESTQ